MTPKSHHDVKPQPPSGPCRQPLPLTSSQYYYFPAITSKLGTQSTPVNIVWSTPNTTQPKMFLKYLYSLFIIFMRYVPCVLSLGFPTKM